MRNHEWETQKDSLASTLKICENAKARLSEYRNAVVSKAERSLVVVRAIGKGESRPCGHNKET